MVLRNPFSGQELRHRCREWTCEHRSGKREGRIQSHAATRTRPCVRQTASGKPLCAQGAQLGLVMTQSGGLGGGGETQEGGGMSNYDSLALMYGRDHHNFVKELSSN